MAYSNSFIGSATDKGRSPLIRNIATLKLVLRQGA